MLLEAVFTAVAIVSGLVGYAIGLGTKRESKAKVCETPDEDPREVRTADYEDGHIPNRFRHEDSRDRPNFEGQMMFHGDFEE